MEKFCEFKKTNKFCSRKTWTLHMTNIKLKTVYPLKSMIRYVQYIYSIFNYGFFSMRYWLKQYAVQWIRLWLCWGVQESQVSLMAVCSGISDFHLINSQQRSKTPAGVQMPCKFRCIPDLTHLNQMAWLFLQHAIMFYYKPRYWYIWLGCAESDPHLKVTEIQPYWSGVFDLCHRLFVGFGSGGGRQ